MKLVSVIMPYYKKKRYLKKSIFSVLNQSYENFEIILINDDPFEDKQFLKNIKNLDSRIKLINNKNQIGAGFSRNKGIKKSKGDYIAFLDCDDYWHKDKLQTQINYMIRNNNLFSFTAYKIIDVKGYIIGKRKAKKYLKFKDLVKSCDIGLSTVILKKKLMKKNLFPNLKTKEDYVLWLKISKAKVEIIGINKFLTFWRKLDNSLSSNTLQKILDGFRVYRIHMKYNIVKSFISLFILSINFLRR